jgi:hypothetical protein
MRVRKGTKMVVVAHHDNSANNKYNPDPNAQVGWGDLTSQEMVLPWFGVVVDKDTDPERLLTIRQTGCSNSLLPGLPRVPGVPGLSVPGLGVPGLQLNIPGLTPNPTPTTPTGPLNNAPIPTLPAPTIPKAIDGK